MADFSHLQEQTLRGKVIEYEMNELETCPVLLIQCAIDNPEYEKKYAPHRADVRRKFEKQQRRRRKGGRKRTDWNSDLESFRLSRGADRVAYVGTVVVGWKTNKDAHGEEVPYDEEVCEQFLSLLPNDVFDELRLYCRQTVNWRLGGDLDPDDEEEIAGN